MRNGFREEMETGRAGALRGGGGGEHSDGEREVSKLGESLSSSEAIGCRKD